MSDPSIDADPRATLSAEFAGRATFVLAAVLTAVQSATGALWLPWMTALYLALALLVGAFAYWPGLPSRERAACVVGTWVVAGWSSLFVAGIREGFVILAVGVALMGAFFGLRAALSLLGASAGVVALAAALFVNGHLDGAPERFYGGRHLDAWVLHGTVFLGLSAMLALIHARINAEQRAASARARTFAIIAEQNSAPLLFTGVDRAVRWSNSAFTRLSGYEGAEVLGKNPGELLQGPGTAAEARRAMREGLDARRTTVVETVNYRKDGVPYWVQLTLEPVLDPSGALVGYTGSQVDVTERRILAAMLAVELELTVSLARVVETREIDAVVARCFAHCESVRYTRVWRPAAGGLAQAAYHASRGPLPTVAAPEATPPPPDAPCGVVAAQTIAGTALTSRRVYFALEDELGGLLEMSLWDCMPGLDLVSGRMARLLALVAAERRRRLDAIRLGLLFAGSPEALLLLDGAGAVRLANDAARALLPALATGDVLAERHPELRAAETLPAVGAATAGGASPAPLALLRSDGAERTVEVRASVVPGAGGGAETLLALRDVTERHRQLAATEAALVEKETLLREIHHRVKNNLQIVSSLLDMQLSSETSPAVQRALRESVLRIQTMAMVHQSLYGTDSLSRIDFGGFVGQLAENLRAGLAPDVVLAVDAEPHEIAVDLAIPLGLVLNELVTNAFKYGRRVGADGAAVGPPCVSVGWRRVGALYHLTVGDDGPGLPQGVELRSARTLGLQLIRALTRQVRGRLDYRGEAGACFTVTVPVAAGDSPGTAARPT